MGRPHPPTPSKHKFADHATFKFGRSNPMSLHVDDIIDPARNLVVSVLVPQRPVPCEVETGVRTVVSGEELVVIFVDGASHSRPWSSYAQVTSDVRSS